MTQLTITIELTERNNCGQLTNTGIPSNWWLALKLGEHGCLARGFGVDITNGQNRIHHGTSVRRRLFLVKSPASKVPILC
jgi:hypothetical protein